MLFRKRHADKKNQDAEIEKKEQDRWEEAFAPPSVSIRSKEDIINNLEKREHECIESAANAKLKGYTDIYDKLLSFIRVIRAKKLFINEASTPLEQPVEIPDYDSEPEAFISRINEQDIERDIDAYIGCHRESLNQENGIESLKKLLNE